MKTLFVILLICIPMCVSAQLLGIGVECVPPKNGSNAIQFQANVAYPTWTNKNLINLFVLSGVDYTGGSSPVSGFNIKPLQLKSYITESLYNDYPFSVFVGMDAGYLFAHRHGKDGITLSPNLHLEYSVFYVNTGWDFNVTGHQNQFYVRLGVGFGLGTFKSIAKTKIR